MHLRKLGEGSAHGARVILLLSVRREIINIGGGGFLWYLTGGMLAEESLRPRLRFPSILPRRMVRVAFIFSPARAAASGDDVGRRRPRRAGNFGSEKYSIATGCRVICFLFRLFLRPNDPDFDAICQRVFESRITVPALYARREIYCYWFRPSRVVPKYLITNYSMTASKRKSKRL